MIAKNIKILILSLAGLVAFDIQDGWGRERGNSTSRNSRGTSFFSECEGGRSNTHGSAGNRLTGGLNGNCPRQVAIAGVRNGCRVRIDSGRFQGCEVEVADYSGTPSRVDVYLSTQDVQQLSGMNVTNRAECRRALNRIQNGNPDAQRMTYTTTSCEGARGRAGRSRRGG